MLKRTVLIHLQLFPLPLSDYILGVCDLTGELMRLAISSISKPNGRMKASQISLFVRGCKAGKTKVVQLHSDWVLANTSGF
jgi:hypothetical protein